MATANNTALTAADIQNILNIMSRVDLKGNEANAYVNCEVKLHLLMKQITDQTGAAPAANKDDGDGASGD